MSKSKKNRKMILLGVLGIAVLIGICFFCVTLYAKNEINKPKFNMPEQPAQTSLTEVLTDKDKAFEYAMQQYTDTMNADDAEVKWRTEVRLDGDWDTPFSEADKAIILHIRDNAREQLESFYPRNDTFVRLSEAKDVPLFDKQAQNVLDFSVTEGRDNGSGTFVDTDRYFLTFTLDPKCEDTSVIPDGETFRKIAKELSPVAAISDTEIVPQEISVVFAVDRISSQLVSVDIRRNDTVRTTFSLTEDSAALLNSGLLDGKITLPCSITQKIEFKHYGAAFTEDAIAVKPGDIKALPARVTVNDASTKADYTLTFTASDPSLLSFDEDGVMSVGKETSDDPLTVTMTLEYNGHTYTDTMTVYISRWEVATTNVGA